MAGGKEQAGVHQFLQDEAVCRFGSGSDVLWSHSLNIQSRVSAQNPIGPVLHHSF